jgi:hypothetical protein
MSAVDFEILDRIVRLEDAVAKIGTVLMELIDAIRDEALKPPPM